MRSKFIALVLVLTLLPLTACGNKKVSALSGKEAVDGPIIAVKIDDTDEELYYLRKCQTRKTPLFIPIKSHSLAPALFYCIRTTTTYLLLAAVAEPLHPLHDLSLPQ